MAARRKKTLDPPYRLWVVVDALTGHPVFAAESPDHLDLQEYEAVYEYTLNVPKLRRNNG